MKKVVAIYNYHAGQQGDLDLHKDEEYDVLDESNQHWWSMRNREGHVGIAPSNYVQEKGNIGLDQHDWYFGNGTREWAEDILLREGREGSFVVRMSSTGSKALSVYSKFSGTNKEVVHYQMYTDREGNYYFSKDIKSPTIPDLIFRHQYNPGGVCTRLRQPPSNGNTAPTNAGFSEGEWEIDPQELTMLEEIGNGQFAVVRHARWQGKDVAVKMMIEGNMNEDDFILEGKTMTKLQHPNVVKLHGVCIRTRPIYIITEYLHFGTLLQYLRTKERLFINHPDSLLQICLQVCYGMAYLEEQKFIHRDLAARNCLVGANNTVKVGDFGVARFVVDDDYCASGGTKFPIKWASPEVLNYMKYSSKSDVWAFGILMWEVFTCGKIPYGKLKITEVVDYVHQRKYLDKPPYCPTNVYEIMRYCWTFKADQRPSFADLNQFISRLLQGD